MEEQSLNIKNQAFGRIMMAETLQDVEALQIEYLGKNGELTKLIKNIGTLSPDDRKQAGLIINETKQTIQNLLNEQKEKLAASREKEYFDATIPGIKPEIGHFHLLTQSINQIETIFTKLGFARRRYPEVDWDWYSFGSLNFPKNHPAWDTLETYFVDAPENKKLGEMVLTPHTSNGQVREMEALGKPPIRMINIGKTYRRQSDISHSPMFHQFEGLVVDKNISITHLKGTLDYFAREFFLPAQAGGTNRKTRLRPYNFRFTEPSFEVDITCGVCDGRGCRICKAGWLELGGAGMVHPNVLRAGGIDPQEYSGFAFGWGVERVTMMKDGINIPDLRLLYSADLNYLKQF
ncbi:MAG: phenylalanine--tRNA ligase subunit alpha [bacterium]|nr:phenylalanine--tRNA ligase subunit alpha [bacterium]